MTGFEWYSLVPICEFLFITAYISFDYLVIYQWLHFTSIAGFINFIGLSFVWGSMMYNYYKASTTDPGKVPKNYRNPESLISNGETPPPLEEAKKSRYCRKCEVEKPPRAHHCSECDRCVLKMDHHCIWLNNCVGFYNHKYFLLFLVYLTITAIWMIVGFIWSVIDIITHSENPANAMSPFDAILTGIELVIVVPTLLMVSCLCAYQMQLVSENTTNIESYEKESAERNARKKGLIYEYPYDKGYVENFKDVFGQKFPSWLIPTEPEGDGINWNTAKSTDGKVFGVCGFDVILV